jgi:hypothetical protein
MMGALKMNYQEVKEILETKKLELIKRMENPDISKEEIELIKISLANYDYILELTDMNHFGRGIVH